MYVLAPTQTSLNYPSTIKCTHTDNDDALEKVVSILRKHKDEDYYTYERGGIWYIGLGCQVNIISTKLDSYISTLIDQDILRHLPGIIDRRRTRRDRNNRCRWQARCLAHQYHPLRHSS